MFDNLPKCCAAIVLGAALLHGTAAWADGDGRKIKNKVTPAYPGLAKQMNVAGTVRIEVTIAPNGTVKSTRPLGGHPLLIQSATDAIKKWRYEPGPESTVVVEFRFNQQ